jgi:DNA-directed RNA polymerase specialized sigma24 family protein
VARTVIDLVAEKHDDWIHMARSFGCSEDDANELVQEMYLRIHRYVESPEKIMYNETEVNTFYIYVTLRNLFLSNFHLTRKALMSSLESSRVVP